MADLELLDLADRYNRPDGVGISPAPINGEEYKPSALEIMDTSVLYKDTLNFDQEKIEQKRDFEAFSGPTSVQKSNATQEPVDAEEAKRCTELLNELLDIILEGSGGDLSNLNFEQIVGEVFKAQAALHQENAGDLQKEINSARNERIKLSEERKKRMREIFKELDSNKMWGRITTFSNAIFAVSATAGAVATGGTVPAALAIVAGIISIGDMIDNELGNPVKRGVVQVFTGKDEQKTNEKVATFSLALSVMAFVFSCGTTVGTIGSKAANEAVPYVFRLLQSGSSLTQSLSSGMQALSEYHINSFRGDSTLMDDKFESLNDRMKGQAKSLLEEYERCVEQQKSLASIADQFSQVNQSIFR